MSAAAKMPTLTIRDLDEATSSTIKDRARQNGRSMEAEVRIILGDAARQWSQQRRAPQSGRELLQQIHTLFAEIGGADDLADSLDALPRPPAPEPLTFDE